jgi:uncharacterized protein
MEPLPHFRYHPDPLKTESISASDTRCIVCDRVRGYTYVVSVYAIEDYDECICPWCIADGSAHAKLDVQFNGGGGIMDFKSLPQSVVDEVVFRTPGFATWQGDYWFTHCGDAAAFLGAVGYKELSAVGKDAVGAIRASLDFLAEAKRDDFMLALDNNGSPTAYLFQCLHCGQYGGYVDFA